MSVPDTIRTRLQSLAPLTLDIVDDSALHAGHAGARAGGGHYRLSIVSTAFAGRNTVARHRMIYDALGDMMRHEIHALAIHARTPEEA
ncbi:MAG TPA: BolA family protein [Zoogloea sp.]|uniref:BolA family protein n=1 Tax=Zoogloea sp. TaxID=49181 RepID=UPI002B51A5BB|nr:BolA family protein [Zoogloea sp.]HMV17442.1 BolA family protein [Rhodocyclaceae bacterium]HMV62335.1 BolA family protein [Rhodocyclaceae bacterium]HMW51950.1 BolA family protein [Rhodocyclaceae bacterium]HMY48541.1 BolA family protein [Rhodocyclaceae bacterium]HMZ76649.1 BolA family protein [Rhodocyclaceae bacterium]